MSFDPASQSKWLLALADARLHSAAGAAVFKRGLAYARSGAVKTPDLTVDEKNASLVARAVVQGTHNYEVEVWVNGSESMPDGDCDCQHSEDGNFCKHQVALALTLRGMLGADAPPDDPEAQKKVAAVAKRALTAAKNKDDLRTFVAQQSASVLSDWIWQQALEDRSWMSDLRLWAAQQKAKTDPAALSKAVSEVLRNSQDFLDYSDSRLYANRAEKALPLLKQALSLDAPSARILCESALKKLYKVGDHADDSNGEIGWVMEQVQAIHLDAIRAAPPDGAWVETWFALMDADPFGNWDENEVIEAAGEAVLQQYGTRVVRDWENHLAQQPASPQPVTPRDRRLPYRSDSFDRAFVSIRKRYLAYLKQQGDVLGMIEAMLKVAQSSWDYHQVIELCEQHGKHREALDLALKAQKIFGKDTVIDGDLLRCYARDGWDEEALAIHRSRLEAHPGNLQFYIAAIDAAVQAGRDKEVYRAELFAWLEHYELTKESGYGYYRTPTGKTRNVTTRVSWLMFDKKPLEALAVAQGASHYCDDSLLRSLADVLPLTHKEQALQIYRTIFNNTMPRATTPYRTELDLVTGIVRRMPPLEASRWVESLRVTYKAKRNFIQGLPTLFSVQIEAKGATAP